MFPLSLILRNVNASYCSTAHLFSTDIGMEFGMKKCRVLTMKKGKVARCEGIKLPNSKVMKEVEKEGYTYLGIVELDKIKDKEMK